MIAELHIEGISTGFISSLGLKFVTALYEAIADDENSFGFVAVDENGKVLGFIVITEEISRLYKAVLKKSGMKFAFTLAVKMFSFSKIKRVVETLFYPQRTKKLDLPKAELLSIVVSAEARGRGLGKKLISAAYAECRKRGVDKIRVLVAESNIVANKMYQNSGFEHTFQIQNHNITSNIYIADTSVS